MSLFDVEDLKRNHPIDAFLSRHGVSIRRQGKGYVCRCALGGHLDKHPSFTISDDHWVCWSHPGGMVHGSIIDLVMIMYGESFREACNRLSRI